MPKHREFLCQVPMHNILQMQATRRDGTEWDGWHSAESIYPRPILLPPRSIQSQFIIALDVIGIAIAIGFGTFEWSESQSLCFTWNIDLIRDWIHQGRRMYCSKLLCMYIPPINPGLWSMSGSDNDDMPWNDEDDSLIDHDVHYAWISINKCPSRRSWEWRMWGAAVKFSGLLKYKCVWYRIGEEEEIGPVVFAVVVYVASWTI